VCQITLHFKLPNHTCVSQKIKAFVLYNQQQLHSGNKHCITSSVKNNYNFMIRVYFHDRKQLNNVTLMNAFKT